MSPSPGRLARKDQAPVTLEVLDVSRKLVGVGQYRGLTACWMEVIQIVSYAKFHLLKLINQCLISSTTMARLLLLANLGRGKPSETACSS